MFCERTTKLVLHCSILRLFWLSAADDTEKHHSGTPPLQFLGKDKSGVVLQLRLLWQHKGVGGGDVFWIGGESADSVAWARLRCLIISRRKRERAKRRSTDWIWIPASPRGFRPPSLVPPPLHTHTQSCCLPIGNHSKKAADPDGMDTYARSAALPCYWSPLAVSSFDPAPSPSPRSRESPAATRPATTEPKQAAWGLIQCIYPCWSSGSHSPATPRVWIPCRTRLTNPPWWSRARCSLRLWTSPRSRTVWMSKCWTCGPWTAGVWSGSSSSPWGNLDPRLRAPKWRRTTSTFFSWTPRTSPWFSRHRSRLWTRVERISKRMLGRSCVRTAVS